MSLVSFNAYHSYLESMELLSDEERGRLFTALLVYSSTGEKIKLPGNERYVFPHMRGQIDRDRAAYRQKCARNSENGKKGGRPPIKEREEKAAKQQIPGIDEVRAYCRERKSRVDPDRFYDYFTEGGWKDSEGRSVLNWKQKLQTWEVYGPENPSRCRERGSEECPVDVKKLKRSMDLI